jgi:hypothetical protein
MDKYLVMSVSIEDILETFKKGEVVLRDGQIIDSKNYKPKTVYK